MTRYMYMYNQEFMNSWYNILLCGRLIQHGQHNYNVIHYYWQLELLQFFSLYQLKNSCALLESILQAHCHTLLANGG